MVVGRPVVVDGLPVSVVVGTGEVCAAVVGVLVIVVASKLVSSVYKPSLQEKKFIRLLVYSLGMGQ